FWFRPSEGERDPLAARALVLQAAGIRVAFVTVDLLAVDRAFTADVERRLAAAGVRPLTLVLAASHTHSGPGAFVDSAVLGWLALDRLDGARARPRRAGALRQRRRRRREPRAPRRPRGPRHRHRSGARRSRGVAGGDTGWPARAARRRARRDAAPAAAVAEELPGRMGP